MQDGDREKDGNPQEAETDELEIDDVVRQNLNVEETILEDEDDEAVQRLQACDSPCEMEERLDALRQRREAKTQRPWVPRAPPPDPAWRPGQRPPRFFSRRECCRLQGFPEDFLLEATDRKCQDPGRFYHFIGNAVAPPVIQAIGHAVLAVLDAAAVCRKASDARFRSCEK